MLFPQLLSAAKIFFKVLSDRRNRGNVKLPSLVQAAVLSAIFTWLRSRRTKAVGRSAAGTVSACTLQPGARVCSIRNAQVSSTTVYMPERLRMCMGFGVRSSRAAKVMIGGNEAWPRVSICLELQYTCVHSRLFSLRLGLPGSYRQQCLHAH